METLNLSAAEIVKKFSKGEIKAVEVVGAYLKNIEKRDKTLNSFITKNENALDAAKKLDAKREQGKPTGRLAGVPVAIKDMLCTKGQKTTAASKILENFIPPYSATVVEKLEAEDAIVIGKTNQDEFAMGSSTENSAFGPCKNPWDLERVPGGSSGGSAAAVAGRLSPIAIGTDTGGSIRQPASFCGIVGAKPTYGRVSRFGIIAFASSLDQAGPMTLNVEDAALTMEVIGGQCRRDSTTSERKIPHWAKSLSQDLKGVKVGLPQEYITDALSTDTKKTLDEAVKFVQSEGAEVVPVSLPHTKLCVSLYYIIATCEASSNLARYDGVRFGKRADFTHSPPSDILEFYSRTRGEGFGTEVKRRIMLGTFALSSGYYEAYYKKACQVRRKLREDFLKAFQSCDVMLSPVCTGAAFKLGEKVSDPLSMYLNDVLTLSTNLAGLPGMSVPGGFTKEGLPIGLQITSHLFNEQAMLNVAYAIEKGLSLKEVPNVLR